MRDRGAAPITRHRAGPPEERSLSGPCFLGSFPRADVTLPQSLPEVAFLGRSNVGKSSLLNALIGQRIAKVSATPGKTRMMNVYEVELVRGTRYAVANGANHALDVHREQPRTAHGALYLLDLPGYGYSRASKADRVAFRRLLIHVVKRPRLAGVVWLLDLRRDPSPDDLAWQDVFATAGTRVLAALTKTDKLPRGQRLTRAGALRASLGIDADQLVVTSARTGDGVRELRDAVAGLVRADAA